MSTLGTVESASTSNYEWELELIAVKHLEQL